MERTAALVEARDRPHKRVSVLLVDDVSEIRRMLRKILERDGRFEIAGEATDGLEGIEAAERLQPDLVLLDLMMPRCGGVEALGRIRDVSPGSGIVIFSALETAMTKLEGPDACLAKGASPTEIVWTLAGVDSRRRRGAQRAQRG